MGGGELRPYDNTGRIFAVVMVVAEVNTDNLKLIRICLTG
jgi:hypothetical protein